MSAETKRLYRERALGKMAEKRSKLVEVDGDEYLIRAPSVKERAEIFQAAGVVSSEKGSKLNIAALQVESVLRCVYVPGSEERVFEAADREMLASCPAGGLADQLFEACGEYVNAKPEEVEKNS